MKIVSLKIKNIRLEKLILLLDFLYHLKQRTLTAIFLKIVLLDLPWESMNKSFSHPNIRKNLCQFLLLYDINETNKHSICKSAIKTVRTKN